MYHNLFRITVLITAIAIILAACGAPAPTTAPVTQTPIATEMAPTNTPKLTATATEAPVVVSVPTELPTMTTLEVVTMTGDDGMILIYVPSGEFTMGSDDGERDEKPVHTVTLDAFWIDQTEVTNELFSSFVSATGYQTDAEKLGSSIVSFNEGSNWVQTNGADWQHPIGPSSDISGIENHPVIHVSWNDAVAYCEWVGRRLSTEAEWEKAARGTDQRTFPWGNEAPNNTLLNYNLEVGATTVVGNYPNGVSPYGALDMAGNVLEWTSDWYDVYPGGPSNLHDVGQAHRVMRSGSWFTNLSDPAGPRSANRSWGNLTDRGSDLGFRCASSP